MGSVSHSNVPRKVSMSDREYTGYKDKNDIKIYTTDIVIYETKKGNYSGEIIPIMGGYAWWHANIDFHLRDMDNSKMKVIEDSELPTPSPKPKEEVEK